MKKIFVCIVLVISTVKMFAEEIRISSPENRISASLFQDNDKMLISLSNRGGSLLSIRPLQFDFEKELIKGNWTVTGIERDSVRQSWENLYGERKHINDHYNSLKIYLSSSVNNMRMILDLRMYDEGIAFRYIFDETDFWNRNLKAEHTEFLFDENCPTWTADTAQAIVYKTTINQIVESADRPQVLKVDDDYLAIGEAGLVDFSRMKLRRLSEGLGLVSDLSGEVNLDLADYKSPWRYVMVADNPGKLVENNYFILNLNEPCKLDKTDWIQPGTVLREVTLTTTGGIACVDFAHRHGIKYVEFDAGWYGHEYSIDSDATGVNVDPGRSKGPLDLQKVIDYAETKGVGIILYVNMKALSKQLDDILPLYRSWGVKGVKYGFVDVGDQYSTSWLHNAVRKAAEYELMVDIHDEYRPTGYSRTYPNLITQEGIRGDEQTPSLLQSVYTFYTRMICGAGDYTNCYFAERVYSDDMGGLAAQFAKRIAIYSPWQFVYWYDRPEGSPHKVGGAGAVEAFIKTDNLTDFYCSIPTVWDETRFIHGDIDDYLVVARRKSDDWYISVLNAGDNRNIEINISEILNTDLYRATFYYQPSANAKGKVAVRNIKSVTPKMTLDILGNSGCVLFLTMKK